PTGCNPPRGPRALPETWPGDLAASVPPLPLRFVVAHEHLIIEPIDFYCDRSRVSGKIKQPLQGALVQELQLRRQAVRQRKERWSRRRSRQAISPDSKGRDRRLVGIDRESGSFECPDDTPE